MSAEDQLNEMLALEHLRMQRRIAVIDRRAKVVLVIMFVVLGSYLPLRILGVSSYGFWRSPLDLLWSDRICMFAGWMVPSGMLVWSLGKFRVIQSQLFLNPKPVRWLPWIAGVIGCVVLAFAVREWVNRPFSGETLRANDAWKFGVAWALLGWAYVFRR
jgi:hypothetical protein